MNAVQKVERGVDVVAEKSTAVPAFMVQAMNTMAGVKEIADMMAKVATMPAHLQGKPEDCFRVVAQAAQWRMNPFAVAECTALVHGKLCYEGKLVAAALKATGAISGRLHYEFSGSGENRSVTVTGTPAGGQQESITGTVAQWKTSNAKWKEMPDDMLVYRGTRQWARRYAPEAMLGVVTPDEEIVYASPAPPAGKPDVDMPGELPAQDGTGGPIDETGEVIDQERIDIIVAMSKDKDVMAALKGTLHDFYDGRKVQQLTAKEGDQVIDVLQTVIDNKEK